MILVCGTWDAMCTYLFFHFHKTKISWKQAQLSILMLWLSQPKLVLSPLYVLTEWPSKKVARLTLWMIHKYLRYNLYFLCQFALIRILHNQHHTEYCSSNTTQIISPPCCNAFTPDCIDQYFTQGPVPPFLFRSLTLVSPRVIAPDRIKIKRISRKTHKWKW